MNLQVNWEKPEVFCYKKSRKIIFELSGVSKTKPEVELSSLTSFVKGLKKKYYTSAAMVVVTKDQPQPALNTTKISPNEDLTDKYVRQDDHGRYTTVATKTLEDLQKTFPKVFQEPTYPVDRTDVGITFEHDIVLEDPTKPPPKKKLYTLDDEELKALKE